MSSIPKTMYSMLLAVLQLQENKVYHTGEMCVYIYIYLYIYTHTFMHYFIHNSLQ